MITYRATLDVPFSTVARVSRWIQAHRRAHDERPWQRAATCWARPSEESRTPTDEEWAEFIGHFERRKVSVGDCGRSYDTPCIHEHSCLRCPLLRPDPTARARLAQIRDNLIARIAEAESHRWLGEAEGLKVSLAGARAKLAEMDQITVRRAQTVQLGVPTFTDAAGRTTTNPPSHKNSR